MHTEEPHVEAVRRASLRRRPFANFKLTALGAALVVYMSVFVVTLGVPRLAQSLTPWESAAPAVGLLAAILACTWSARVIRRFCGRLVPVSISGEHMLAPALACIAGSVFAGVWCLRTLRPLVTSVEFDSWYELATGGTWCIALAIQSREDLYRRPIKKPYVLYLRTFLGFSDRAMMAALFTIIAGRKRIVVLTPSSNSASWDPVLIAFRGNPLLRLSVSSPVFLKAPDHDWKSAVRDLADGASQILIDVSDLSPGIRAEIEMIGEEGVSKKVIWLSESSNADRVQEVRSFVRSLHIPADRLVFYTRSWTAAWPNLLLGACIIAPFLFLVLSDPSGSQLLRESRVQDFVGWAIGSSGPFLLFFALVFARPAVDSHARNALRVLLAQPSGLGR